MRVHAPELALALLTMLTLSACDKPDVGQRCVLAWGDSSTPNPTPATIGGDFFETGNFACDDLVCIISPAQEGSKYAECQGEACGYCSKPCVSDRDCFSGQTGLKCLPVVLDDVFLASLDPDTRQRYLGEVQSASYCVVPRKLVQ